jgi:hypothetical protein
MKRLSLLVLVAMLFAGSAVALGENGLATLESAAQFTGSLQPGLQHYRTTVVTDRIATMIQASTASMPADMPRPAVPTVIKYWRLGAPRSVIVATGTEASPFMQQMVERISSNLAIEPDELVLPPGKGAERLRLAEQATVKSTETTVADNVLQRVELLFAIPAALGDAFYGSGLRLPRDGIVKLQFDIDARTRTVRELAVQTTAGDQLLAEFRYRPARSGLLVERVRVTSPDGKVDDRLEVTFTEVAGYLLPEKIVRVLNRPGLQDNLEVTFTDYRVNQPFPAEIEAQLAAPVKPAMKTP